MFEDLYADQVTTQLDGREESIDLEPVSLSLLVLKEQGAKWLVQMTKYFADNPQIIVNGFVKAGITDGQENEHEEVHEVDDDSEDDFELYHSSDDDGTCY